MSFAEPGSCWEGDDDFESILNILDFPMESLGDDGFVADWDISKSHCLGPIPSGVLMGPPTGTIAPVSKGESGPIVIQPNKPQESGVFQSQSPVSVLENNGSSSTGKNLPNPIPVRARSKRVKRLTPWLPAYAHFTSAPRKVKDEIKKSPTPQAIKIENPSPNCHVVTKRCTHCDVTKTPQWREGPLGPKSLCNACGVRYRSGRLFPEYRPAASPTFVPALHSNSHKKVIEMRTKGKGPMVKVEKGPESPQPEFVPMSKYLFDYMY